MTKGDFERQVSDAFGASLRASVVMESSITSPQFGDASVTLGAPKFRLRVSRDRGLVSVDVSGRERPDDWYPFEWAVAVVTEGPPATPGTLGLEESASLLQAHFEAVGEALGGPRVVETEKRFDEFAEQRLAALERGEWPLPPR